MNEHRVICDDLYLEKIHIATVVFFDTTSLFFSQIKQKSNNCHSRYSKYH